MGKKVYISGQISGLYIEEATEKFNQAETSISALGFEPVNPIKVLPFEEGLTYKDYMKADIIALLDCDYILMLSNYINSKGALLEKSIAESLGILVVFDLDQLLEFDS